MGWPICFLLIRYRVLDQPNQRSSHVTATPRGGGIAVLASIGVACWWVGRLQADPLTWALPAVSAVVGVISLMDDIRGLSAAIRFGTHLVGAASLIWAGGIAVSNGERAVLSERLGIPMAVVVGLMLLWIVGYTNSFNFMDGINGLAGMQAGVGALAMAVVCGSATGRWDSLPVLVALAVSGSAFGFLPHNFPKARMFMGDVGSAPLGMILAFLALWMAREHGYRLFIPLALIHANFILDTAITLIRRVLRGENWLKPHREHFYQRLIRSGRSHAFVTGCEFLLLLVSALVSVVAARAGWAGQWAAAGFVSLIWVGFFAFAEVGFRRHQTRGPVV